MIKILRYIVIGMLFISFILFYLLNTKLGNKNIYSILSYAVSKKIGLDTKIISINIDNYPKYRFDLVIENKFYLNCSGLVDDNYIDVKYKVTNDKYNLRLNGKIKGPFFNISIDGDGQMYDDDISFDSIYNYGKKELKGITKSYEGELKFTLKDHILRAYLHQLSFIKILKSLSKPPFMDAKTDGTVVYNIKNKVLKVDTVLQNAIFTNSKFAKKIYEKTGVDIVKETFNNSSLFFTYYDKSIMGEFKLRNKKHHLLLTNIDIDDRKNSIDANFNFDIQEQKFVGNISGKLDNPKINLDMQKLIKYQIDKKFDSLIGKENMKIMKSIPMADTAEDMATGVAASFINIFF